MELLTTLSRIAAAAAPIAVDLALKAAVVLLLATVVAGLLRTASASVRHLVWGLGIAGALALPALSAIVPAWRMQGIPSVVTTPAESPAAVPRATRTGSASVVPSTRTVATAPAASPDSRAAVGAASSAGTSRGIATLRPSVARATVPPPAAAPVPAGIGWPAVSPLALLVAAWLLGTVIVLLTLVVGVTRSHHLAQTARPVTDPRRTRLVRELARAVGIRRPVRLLERDGRTMPMTWGAARPVVLLPTDSLTWSESRLRAVLLHELAHVKRHDYATQLVARVACATYWFNPLTWLAARRLREERELACDDLVLNCGSRASEYAGHLLDVARSLRPAPLSTVATVCMARRSQLGDRLHAILDATRRRMSVSPQVAIPATIVALAVVVPLAALTGAAPDSPEPAAAEQTGVATAGALETVAAIAAGATETGPVEPKGARPGLGDRVKRFIDDIAESAPTLLTAWRNAPQGCDWDTNSEHMSASTNVNDDTWRIRVEIGNCELRIDAEGEVKFSDDDRDIVEISRGGFLNIEERDGRRTWRMEFRPRDGGIERRWIVDRDEQWTTTGDVGAQDPEAARWLADMLLVVFRRTGFNAPARAQRILAAGGVDSLLTEVSFMRSDWAAGKYYEVLLSEPGLDASIIQRVVRDAGRNIESDHTLGQILMAVAREQPMNEAIRGAFLEAVGSIESDYQHAQVLTAVLEREGVSQEVAGAMLRSARQIDSDYQRTELLKRVLEAHPLDQALTQDYFDAIRDIESDYQQHQILSAILQKGAPSIDVLDQTLALATNIDSDHQLAELLIQVADLYPMGGELPTSYLRAAETIESSYNRSRVLRTLLARDNVTTATVASVLGAASMIESDHEMQNLLGELAEAGPLTPELRAPYFRALAGLDSDHSHGQVLLKVIEHQTLDDALARDIMRSATSGIDSDHTLGEVLIALAESYGVNDAIRADFMSAVDSIGSEYTRGRVLNAAFPRGRRA